MSNYYIHTLLQKTKLTIYITSIIGYKKEITQPKRLIYNI
ncbi:hypothetical protein Buni01_02589 [Bacteroides uniformis]